jgi:peptide/nickel transport system permease protein
VKTKSLPRVRIAYTLKILTKNPLVLIGMIIATIIVIVALFSHVLVDPNLANTVTFSNQLCWGNHLINWGPGSTYCRNNHFYFLGTDYFGRDLLSMIILALPLDLAIAGIIVTSAFFVGLSLGSIAAYSGSFVDNIILRITDLFLSIPALLLALVIAVVFGPSLINLTLIIMVLWWPIYTRLSRGQILAEKEKNYVEALKSMGAGDLRIIFRHIVPNSIFPLLVQATIDIGSVILIVSSLMFLGFSPAQNLPELGNLVSEGIQNIYSAQWLIIFPGATIFIVALAFNLMGDGLRDILDPRLRR